ncbi:hypothetical protein ATO6_12445 [Oceanicola sp. 22II-s10i]|uniref:hypothetical protein n=1 Tax=Oceanicola sp. 22II-s10i TaxID=1317116 RepID=UPI000B524873|nr:hypothetical protein [Oceanicola sp. 22II-s10i]OWU84489.1 hypothetical protein ATO6_12445 [Oceanicola sp. 22II-s10i]
MRRAGAAFFSLLAAVLCIALALSPRLNPMVGEAERFQRDVAIASGATYISLRAINAALSFAQEVEIGGSVVVTGSVQPFKWLEPVDDTVERVSGLIFAIAVLTGVLSMSMAPAVAAGFFLLALAFLGRGGCEAAPGGWAMTHGGLRRALGSCGGLGFALAIALPFAFILGLWGGEFLTREAWATAHATLDRIGNEANALIGVDTPGGDERGWRESFEAYRSAASVFWNSADELLDASLSLTGIFILRMVVLPSLTLLIVLRTAWHLFGRGH